MRGIGAARGVGSHTQWKRQALPALALFAAVAAGAYGVHTGDTVSSPSLPAFQNEGKAGCTLKLAIYTHQPKTYSFNPLFSTENVNSHSTR